MCPSNATKLPLGFADEAADSLIPSINLRARKRLKLIWSDGWPGAGRPLLYHRAGTVSVHIGIVGKYVKYEDSYKSLKEALTHAAVSQTSSSK